MGIWENEQGWDKWIAGRCAHVLFHVPCREGLRLLCLDRYAGLLPRRVSGLLLLGRCAGLLLMRVSRLLGLGRYASLLPGRVSRLFPWAAEPAFCW